MAPIGETLKTHARPHRGNFEDANFSTENEKFRGGSSDAEWIPGEERRHRLKMNAMKPSGNHTSVASVAGRSVTHTASAPGIGVVELSSVLV